MFALSLSLQYITPSLLSGGIEEVWSGLIKHFSVEIRKWDYLNTTQKRKKEKLDKIVIININGMKTYHRFWIHLHKIFNCVLKSVLAK